jgi:hypothetical protein
MQGTTTSPKGIWSDRFSTPGADALVDALRRDLAPAVQHARERLMAGHGLSEQVRWQGVWCWTLVYSCDAGHGVAYVIPDPARPRLGLAVKVGGAADLPLKKLTRVVRDAVLHAPVVDGFKWVALEITSKAAVDEALAVLELVKAQASAKSV